MQFAAPAEHYDRFMGRYAPTLAAALADAAGVESGRSGCSTWAAGPAVSRASWPRASAPRTSRRSTRHRSSCAACRERHPGADVREGVAEELPWADGEFDAALSRS